jgi:hypothetical protein
MPHHTSSWPEHPDRCRQGDVEGPVPAAHVSTVLLGGRPDVLLAEDRPLLLRGYPISCDRRTTEGG